MRCPACNLKIRIMNNPGLVARFVFKKNAPCPYCHRHIFKPTNHTGEYFKLVFFSIFLIGVILILLALIFGTYVGYQSALVICFWYWMIAVVMISMVVMINLIFLGIKKMLRSHENC